MSQFMERAGPLRTIQNSEYGAPAPGSPCKTGPHYLRARLFKIINDDDRVCSGIRDAAVPFGLGAAERVY
ncbi:hypothetical protein [Leucobacter sp. 7(1)]|uniref:hypothetical protein n=1 Tax=Leucobacter sp. 7(1) TaxID=1255613 RepID=UPI0020CC2876|nr:hypothetical protein [Leucobacter sp. 7(1)]